MVLPLTNMEQRSEQLFADGITENILTELSRFRELFVISKFELRLQGQGVEYPRHRPRSRRAIRAQRRRRKAGDRVPHDRTAHRSPTRSSYLGGSLRSTAQGCLRYPGRGHYLDRRHAAPVSVEAARPASAPNKPTDDVAAYEVHTRRKAAVESAAPEADSRSSALVIIDHHRNPGYAHARAWKACVLGRLGSMAVPTTAIRPGGSSRSSTRRWHSTTTTTMSSHSCRRQSDARRPEDEHRITDPRPCNSTPTTTSLSCSRADS